MEELIKFIRYEMLREFKNNKNANETAKHISSVYDHSFITNHQVWNWF